MEGGGDEVCVSKACGATPRRLASVGAEPLRIEMGE